MKAPPSPDVQNLPPSAGLQFFGLVEIDGATEQMTVRLMDRADAELYKVTLDPVRWLIHETVIAALVAGIHYADIPNAGWLHDGLPGQARQ